MEKTNKAEDYLDEQFPKGDKKRGEAMCLYALTKLEARKELIKKFERIIDEHFGEIIKGERDWSFKDIEELKQKLKEIENEK